MRRNELIERFERAVDANGYRGRDATTEKEYAEAKAAISAALSIEQTEPVRVKALAWSLSYSSDDETSWSAMAIGGVYTVRQLTSSSGAWLHRDHAEKRYPSVAEAKSAAQQDYETRILSALVNAQADADVVERWQPIETAPHSKQVLVFVPRGDQPKNLPVGSWHIAYQTEPAPPLAQTWRYSNGQFRGEQIGWPTHWMPLPEPPALSSLRPAEVGSATTSFGAGGDE